MRPDPRLRAALLAPRPDDEPPPDLLAELVARVPAPAPRRPAEPWLWAAAPLLGGALLAAWAVPAAGLSLPTLEGAAWLAPLLLAGALHAAWPRPHPTE